MTSLIAKTMSGSGDDGLQRSARLMHALGARGGPIWSELTPEEAGSLSAAMEQLDAGSGAAQESIASAFLKEGDAEQPTTEPGPRGAIWRQLATLETTDLKAILANEHPQTIALIVSRVDPAASARLLRSLTPPVALDVLRRLLKSGTPHPGALSAVEARLTEQLSAATTGDGHERVARIFDRLDGRDEKMLLAALDKVEPGAGERVRSLMFTFDDLGTLSAAGLQTLLSAADRQTVVRALKGAEPATADAFYGNMTTRAGAFLREEIEAAGPIRRSDIETARAELVTLARNLIQSGEIGPREGHDDELVE